VSHAALTQSALLGTARRPPPELALPGGIAGAAPTPERQLLRAAAVLGLMRRAGELPRRVTRLPDPAPEERRAPCGAPAASHLRAILDGAYAPLLGEWLGALARTGRVVPAELLRPLLDRGSADPAIALALEPVLPERARWLAGHEPAWEWAAGGEPEERWRTAPRAVRMHVLRTLRRADPGAARELLAATFAQDGAGDREAFLALLADGLGAADEPFLESTLDDRAHGVREQAAALLARLPGSALSGRMAARLEPLIELRGRRLAVALPVDDEALRRDGVSGRAPVRAGKRAGLLFGIVAAAPLDVWQRADADPRALLARRVEDGLGELLRAAWTVATVRAGDARWAEALLAHSAGQGAEPALLTVAGAVGARRVAALLAAGDPQGDLLAGELPAPWDAPFAEQVARRLPASPLAPRLAAALGLRADPARAGELTTLLAGADPEQPAGRAAREAAALLDFRRQMLATLEETTSE
jgi:hypothetical protein